jgi:hypothetical protein
MSVDYGFYNSVNNDRIYNAEDFGKLFDGIISDGIFANIGTSMLVTKTDVISMGVNVGIGKAWFKNSFTSNTTILNVAVPAVSTSGKSRIDLIVLQVDKTNRVNSIMRVAGVEAVSPAEPVLVKNDSTKVYQYPLCKILVTYGMTGIPQSAITNYVGTAACPFVTGLITTMTTDQLLSQWNSEFGTWFNTLKTLLSSDQSAGATIASLQTKMTTVEGKLVNVAGIEVVSSIPAGAAVNGKILLKIE